MSSGRKTIVPVLTEVLQVPSAGEAASPQVKRDAAVAPKEAEVSGAKPAASATPYRETPADVVERISLFDTGSSLLEPDSPATPAAPATTAAPANERPQTASARAGAPDDVANLLIERVLVDVQRQVDLMIEHRLATALEPSIERLTQAFAIEARHALHAALRDVVERAVRQELDRVRASG